MPKLDEMNFILARETFVGLYYVFRRQMHIDASGTCFLQSRLKEVVIYACAC